MGWLVGMAWYGMVMERIGKNGRCMICCFGSCWWVEEGKRRGKCPIRESQLAVTSEFPRPKGSLLDGCMVFGLNTLPRYLQFLCPRLPLPGDEGIIGDTPRRGVV